MIYDAAKSLLTGELVSLSVAIDGVYYECIYCGEHVYKKASRSRKVVPHWCHTLQGSNNACPGKSNHTQAIYYLANYLRENKTLDVQAVHKDFPFSGCFYRVNAAFEFPAYDVVSIEYRDGTVIWDIALIKNGLVVAGVEVFYSHRTIDDRERSYVPWLEVSYLEDTKPCLKLISFHRLHGSRKRCRCEKVKKKVESASSFSDWNRQVIQEHYKRAITKSKSNKEKICYGAKFRCWFLDQKSRFQN